ncbi:MAG: hypothetical protein AAF561_02680 [Planctomycetota bacterium]
MNKRRAKQGATILWSVGIAAVLLVLTATVMLPSTKRASPDVIRMIEERWRLQEEQAATRAATQPASQPTTRSILDWPEPPFASPPLGSTKVYIPDRERLERHLKRPTTRPAEGGAVDE